ncbi:hypothetical protein KEM48_006543 [Puccinia striiformis f. sp. tritici PST-130]|nr:hypothetical protein KEM48_006543 [Puccinia striiformis f. sp. tritici PST-130]
MLKKWENDSGVLEVNDHLTFKQMTRSFTIQLLTPMTTNCTPNHPAIVLGLFEPISKSSLPSTQGNEYSLVNTPSFVLCSGRKRNLKLASSKEGLIAMSGMGLGNEVMFNDKGEAHQAYKFLEVDECKKHHSMQTTIKAFVVCEKEQV